MFARIAVLISLAASSMATVFLTAPVAGTTCSGGSSCTISWQDDGTTPSLDTFGNSKVSIAVGSQIQQTMLQTVTPSANVATTSSIAFTVDPSIGSNGAFYFVRFDSVATATNGSALYQAFSAKFTLNNMSGTFNSTVQSQISGTESASGSASGSASATSTSSSSTKLATSTSSKATGSSSASASGSSASSSSAAGRTDVAGGLIGVAGVIAALFSLTF